MKKIELQTAIENLGKTVFDVREIMALFPQETHIHTTIKRLKDSGTIVQITRGMYHLAGKALDIEKFATQIYYPSYISFESALSKYGIINQGIYGLTLATTRHSKKITLGGVECTYAQLKKSLFFGFSLVGDTYIAEPEKAVLDMFYATTFGKKANISTDEWDLAQIDQKKIHQYAKAFSVRVQNFVQETFGK